MYLDLYNGLNLRPKDLEKYDSPLVGFDGRMVIPCRMIRLPVQAGDKEVQVDFIVVEAYSLYTTILARPWLHVIGAVLSTLHLKVKFPTQGKVRELVGSQAMAWQCLRAAITRQPAGQAVVEEERIPQQSKGPEVGLGTESQGVLSEEMEKVLSGQDEER